MLEAIAEHPSPVTAKEVADELELNLPTAYHLLTTLGAAGYVAKVDRTYRLTQKLADLQAAHDRNFRPDTAAWSALRDLVDATSETVYISRWQQGDVVIAGIQEGRQAVRVGGLHVGMRGHVHARASGKVLLAFGDPARLDAFIARADFQAVTPNTITDAEALRHEVGETRRRGYAIDREEFLVGVCCLAVAIRESNGIANTALCVTAPVERFDAQVPHLVRQLTQAAKAVLAARQTKSALRPGTRQR